MFNDFAEDAQYDCFGAIMEKFQVSFRESLAIVNRDFGLELDSARAVPEVFKEQPKLKKRPRKTIQIEVKKWTEDELEYWEQQGVTKDQLIKYNVYSVEKVLKDGIIHWESTPENPIFGYVIADNEGNEAIKCYRPLDREAKWISSTTTKHINGFNQLPFLGDLVVITKSMKDVMVLDNFGYTSIAPQGENNKLTGPQWESLKHTFKRIVIFYDNDISGMKAAQKAADELNCDYVYIPHDYMVKDISDFHKMYGPSKTKQLLENLFNND